jgi:hypothetical protein
MPPGTIGKGKYVIYTLIFFIAGMTAYQTNLMMYYEIHRMNREGFSISRISHLVQLKITGKSLYQTRLVKKSAVIA